MRKKILTIFLATIMIMAMVVPAMAETVHQEDLDEGYSYDYTLECPFCGDTEPNKYVNNECSVCGRKRIYCRACRQTFYYKKGIIYTEDIECVPMKKAEQEIVLAKGLVYNGEEQQLIASASDVDGAVIYYARGREDGSTGIATEWSQSFPTAVNSGPYLIYRKVLWDDGDEDTPEIIGEVYIGACELTLPKLSDYAKSYGDKAFMIKAATNDPDAAFEFSSDNAKVLQVNKNTGKATIKGTGKAVVTVYTIPSENYWYPNGWHNYKKTKRTLTVTVSKGTNTLSAAGLSPAIKKAASSCPVSKLMKFSDKGKGTLSYSIKSVSKNKNYFKINSKTGKLSFKKNLPAGKYTVKINVKAAGNANYKSKTIAVKTVIKVK